MSRVTARPLLFLLPPELYKVGTYYFAYFPPLIHLSSAPATIALLAGALSASLSSPRIGPPMNDGSQVD